MTIDHEFNMRMSHAKSRGILFSKLPSQQFKRESGIPYGYFKSDWRDAVRNAFNFLKGK